MPSSRNNRGDPRNVTRCVYKENGRRCVRNGVPNTDPSLCAVHVVVFTDMGRPPPQRSKIVDVLDDLLSGERVSRDRLQDAASELLGNWGIGGNMAAGYYPDIDEETGATDHGGARFRPAPGFQFPPGWFGRGGAPQPEPEEVAFEREQSAARLRARQVLGFAQSEPLTKDIVKARLRELAKKHHPDFGGKVEKMQEINAAVDVLMGSLPP